MSKFNFGLCKVISRWKENRRLKKDREIKIERKIRIKRYCKICILVFFAFISGFLIFLSNFNKLPLPDDSLIKITIKTFAFILPQGVGALIILLIWFCGRKRAFLEWIYINIAFLIGLLVSINLLPK